MRIHLSLFCLLVCIPVLAKPKPAPVQYSNVRAIPASCDVVWRNLVPVLANHGFMPESSDRAGGFMRLRFTRGDFTRPASKAIKALTLYQDHIYFLAVWEALRIVSGSLSVVEDGQQCITTIQLEYQAFESNARKSWVSMQSNNALENAILVDLE